MKIFAFVLIVFISSKSSFSSETILEEEAVFQGNCKRENLCSQLCYELHDGMFECACDVGFELLEDGYSCSKTRNISQTSSSSESKLDEDYNSSDVFYQKGVSFSAKLDDTETYETNLSSSIVDTLPDNQPRDLTSFESKIEPNNESSFVLSTNNNNIINNNNNDNKNNNNFNIPRFHQTSHLAFHPLKGANLVTEIIIEFRPEDINGTLLFSGERDDMSGDFMIVSLNEGYVEFIFNCGSGAGKIRSTYKVILNDWNSLTIYRYKWEGWIELNEQRRKRGRSTGIFSRITFRSSVYLGGIGNETNDSLKNAPGFSGCIRKFIVNGKSYIQTDSSNFTKPAIVSSSNLAECQNDECSYMKCMHGGRCQKILGENFCQCSLGWSGVLCEDKMILQNPQFNGSSYLRYSALEESTIIWLEIKMIIKPKSLDGLLLFSGQNDVGDFISLHLNFGYVEFNFDLGSGSTSVKSKYPISLNEWHTIRISRTARLAVLRVDTQPEVMNISPNGFWHLSLPYSLFLGGVPRQNLLPSNLRELGAFIGCMKELQINNRKIELIDEALGGFDITNCDGDDECNQDLCTTQSTRPTSYQVDNEMIEYTANKNNQKYAFDVVEINDDEVQTYDNLTTVNSLEYSTENKLDDIHNKKIVRMSIQKVDKMNDKLKEICFNENYHNYTFYGFNKSIKYEKMYQQINVNIRFKTSHENGLLLFIYQKLEGAEDIFLSLSIEDGFMRLKYNYKNAYIDIKHDINNVNDGLWHRVRASRKKLRGSLTIDNLKSISHRTKIRKFSLNGTPGIYIGGSFYTRKIPEVFDGCISDFSISAGNEKHHLDLHNNNAKTSESNVNFYDETL